MATADNRGHTATLRYAQIGSLRSPTSYVRNTLSVMSCHKLEGMGYE